MICDDFRDFLNLLEERGKLKRVRRHHQETPVLRSFDLNPMNAYIANTRLGVLADKLSERHVGTSVPFMP